MKKKNKMDKNDLTLSFDEVDLNRSQILKELLEIDKLIDEKPVNKMLVNINEAIETLNKYQELLEKLSSDELLNLTDKENKNENTITDISKDKFEQVIQILSDIRNLFLLRNKRKQIQKNLRKIPKKLSFNTEESSFINHMKLLGGSRLLDQTTQVNDLSDLFHLGDKITLKKFDEAKVVSLQKIIEVSEFFESSPKAFINVSQLENYNDNYHGKVNGPSTRIDSGGYIKRIQIHPLSIYNSRKSENNFDLNFQKLRHNIISAHNVITEQRWHFYKIDTINDKRIEELLSDLSSSIQSIIDYQFNGFDLRRDPAVDFSLNSQLKGVNKKSNTPSSILDILTKLKREGFLISFGNYNHAKRSDDEDDEYVESWTLRKILLLIVSKSIKETPRFVSVDGGQDFDVMLTNRKIRDKYKVNGTNYGLPDFTIDLTNKIESDVKRREKIRISELDQKGEGVIMT